VTVQATPTWRLFVIPRPVLHTATSAQNLKSLSFRRFEDILGA